MNLKFFASLILATVASGCVLAPEGTQDQRDRVHEIGTAYEPPVEKRELPELPNADVDWHDILHRAFLANGDLEAAYFEWAAAVSRVDSAAAYPNTNLAPSFSYMFSGGNMKSFDRLTTNVGFDPMSNLAFPAKISQAGKVALADARAKGERFTSAKFALQVKVLDMYYELEHHAENIRLQRKSVALLQSQTDNAAARLAAGSSQQDLIRAQIELARAKNDLANFEAEHAGHKALLNAMLARPIDAPLHLPRSLPPPRKIPADDSTLLAMGVAKNPDLAAIAHEVAGRTDALELAKMAWIPDINPSFAFTGSISQSVGAMVILPTTVPKIRAQIEEARLMMRQAEAMARQAKLDRAAEFVSVLFILRNAERQADFFEHTLLPKAEQSLASQRRSYSGGSTMFADLIESERMILDIRMMISEARIEREKQLAKLEQLAGTDIEALPRSATTQPTTRPRENHHED